MKLLPLALVAAGLIGCTATPPRVAQRVEIIAPPADLPRPAAADAQAPVEPPAPAAPPPPPAPPPDPPPPPPLPPAPPPAPPPLPHGDVILFGPDAYKVEARYRPVLANHAANLRASPQLRLLIQAHADPKGPRDYNLALSKKRAETVARQLRELGVPPQQLILSHHGEEAGARRVELSYRRAGAS